MDDSGLEMSGRAEQEALLSDIFGTREGYGEDKSAFTASSARDENVVLGSRDI